LKREAQQGSMWVRGLKIISPGMKGNRVLERKQRENVVRVMEKGTVTRKRRKKWGEDPFESELEGRY